MKRLVLIYPPGERAALAPLAALLRGANPDARVTRRLSPSARTISLLVIDKRHGNPIKGV